ncbi:MAG: hypothetical protein ACFE9A_19345 [Candidatus Hodarchaeota archaeon]
MIAKKGIGNEMADYFFRIIMILYIAVLGLILYFFGQKSPKLYNTDPPRYLTTFNKHRQTTL